jgi:hypothetical protein
MISRASAFTWAFLLTEIGSLALIGCSRCEEPPPAPLPPRRPAASLGEPQVAIAWPPSFTAVSAPPAAWGDHQLAVHPTTDEVWLAAFREDEGGDVVLARFTDGRFEAETAELPEHQTGSFLRFSFDGAGDPHLLYRRVIGEAGAEDHEAQLLHVHRRDGEWHAEAIERETRDFHRASSVGYMTLDETGEVAFLYQRPGDPPTLVRSVNGALRSRVLETPSPVGEVIAFEVGETQVRFLWTNPSRSQLFLTTVEGSTLLVESFREASALRAISAAFGAEGWLHIAAERDRGVNLTHIVVDRDGIHRSDVAPLTLESMAAPKLAVDGAGSLVAYRQVAAEEGALWVSRVRRRLDPIAARVGPLERDVDGDHFVDHHGPPVVDGEGRLFIGTRGWIEGPGTIWVSQPSRAE